MAMFGSVPSRNGALESGLFCLVRERKNEIGSCSTTTWRGKAIVDIILKVQYFNTYASVAKKENRFGSL